MTGNEKIKAPHVEVSVMPLNSGDTSRDWSHDQYQFDEVHRRGFTGKGKVIVIFDTGIDPHHSCFDHCRDRIRIHNVTKTSTDGIDRNGHGSWCGSKFAGRGSVKGWCPDFELLISVKVIEEKGDTSPDRVYEAFDLVLDKYGDQIDLISMSIGWSKIGGFINPRLTRIIQRCKEMNIILVAAAGNGKTRQEGAIDLPAAAPYVMANGAHDQDGKPATFSDIDSQMSFYGPGVDVVGAWIDNRVVRIKGSSMGNPHVGAMILILKDLMIEKTGACNETMLSLFSDCAALKPLDEDGGASGADKVCRLMPIDIIDQLERRTRPDKKPVQDVATDDRIKRNFFTLIADIIEWLDNRYS